MITYQLIPLFFRAPYAVPTSQQQANGSTTQQQQQQPVALIDYIIATNMVTFLILMRIERVEGASAYLTKNKLLVLRQLGYNPPTETPDGLTCGSSDLNEWQQEALVSLRGNHMNDLMIHD